MRSFRMALFADLAPGARTRVFRQLGELVRVVANFRYDGISLAVDDPFFVADAAYTVKSITGRVETAATDLGAVTATIRKAASGTAIASGTALHSGSFDLKGAAATNQALTVTVTTLAAGEAICFDLTGIATAGAGVITVVLEA